MESPTTTYSLIPPTKFKKVDCHSINRRESEKSKYNCERLSNPEKSNKSRRENSLYSRIKVKVTVPPSSKPHESICKTMREFFKKMFQADSNLTINLWKRLSISNVLDEKSELPKSITGLSKYCCKMYALKEGIPATLYPQIFIRHDKEFEDIQETLQPYLQSKLFGIYYQMLKAEDAKDVGWLLYSTLKMDTGVLANEIIDMIGIDIGLRWNNVPSRSRKQENMVN